MNFPNPCTHCGFCCIAQQCPVSLVVHGPRKPGETCPALSFNGDESSCALVASLGPETMGSGIGCCTSATVVMRGQLFDFASLPAEAKTMAVRQIRTRPGSVLDKRTLKPVA